MLQVQEHGYVLSTRILTLVENGIRLYALNVNYIEKEKCCCGNQFKLGLTSI